METRTVNLYRFCELNEKAQQKIINKNIDMFIDDFENDANYLKDLWLQDLKEAGFNCVTNDIHYSGFYSQGDGLSFTCNNINTAAVLAYAEKHGYEKEVCFLRTMPSFNDVQASISFIVVRTIHRYVHKYSVTVRENTADTLIEAPQTSYIADKIYALIEQVRIDLCDKFYNKLEQEWEEIQSFDYVFDWFSNCDNNLYLKNGRRWVESEA